MVVFFSKRAREEKSSSFFEKKKSTKLFKKSPQHENIWKDKVPHVQWKDNPIFKSDWVGVDCRADNIERSFVRHTIYAYKFLPPWLFRHFVFSLFSGASLCKSSLKYAIKIIDSFFIKEKNIKS